MATLVGHAVVALTCCALFPVKKDYPLYLLAIISAILPDIDVVSFRLGIPYSDLWGHRGITHSILFALLWSGLLAQVVTTRPAYAQHKWQLAGLFFLATLSHGVIDALTNGGLGIAFFVPFDHGRYFFPWTPIKVSPIGKAFFSERGLAVLYSELKWIGLPCLFMITSVCSAKKVKNMLASKTGQIAR